MGDSRAAAGPIFVVGTGRCGSTIVDSVLAMHPDFAWTPSWVDSFPHLPVLALANRLWDLPGTDRFRESRFFPTPVEPYDSFRRHVRSFNRESLDAEVVREHRERLVPLVERIRRYHGKPRFLAKCVGRPVKVDLFATLFPDAFFVHVTRDLRPTLSSLLRVAFYQTHWSAIEEWPWEPVPEAWLELYRRHGASSELGAAIGLRLNRAALDRQLAGVDPARWMAVPYAGFVADPLAALRRIADRAGFAVDPGFAERVAAREVYAGADDTWKRHFSNELVRALDEFEALAAA